MDMAVGVLPGISSCKLSSNCAVVVGRGGGGVTTDVLMCVCRLGMAMVSPSRALGLYSSCVQPVHRSSSARRSCSQARAVCLQGNLSSRGALLLDLRTSGISGKDQQRAARLILSAAKDSGRDVLPHSDSHGAQVAYPRLSTTRTGSAENEIETEPGEEQEKVGETEQMLSSSDGERHNSKQEESPIPGTSSSDYHSTTSQERKPDAQKEQDSVLSGGAAIGTLVAGLGLIGLLGGFGALGFFYKDQINAFLIHFSDFIEGYGPAGYGLFVLVYAGLEVLAIPAIPLTMSAGLLFGTTIGTVIVSIAGTLAATGAFLIARYLARDRLLEMTKNNKKLMAIDKAIGEDGFRVVTLLRLSPLLPFSLGNYLYGLTSVKLGPYVLGSWLGMLPGTWAYVSAGAIGRAFIQQETEAVFSGSPDQLWTIGLGLLATVFAASYVTRIAKEALKDID